MGVIAKFFKLFYTFGGRNNKPQTYSQAENQDKDKILKAEEKSNAFLPEARRHNSQQPLPRNRAGRRRGSNMFTVKKGKTTESEFYIPQKHLWRMKTT